MDCEVLEATLKKLNFFSPTIDLFASRLNAQYERYVSFRPDPEAFAVTRLVYPGRALTSTPFRLSV